jgi:hypothetical protein
MDFQGLKVGDFAYFECLQTCHFENLVHLLSIYFKILDFSVSRWNHFIAKCKQSKAMGQSRFPGIILTFISSNLPKWFMAHESI